MFPRYTVNSYKGAEIYKWKYDVTREKIPDEYSVGKNGFDKNLSLEEVIIHIAIPKRANLIVKPGPNAKWYVKIVSPEDSLDAINEKGRNYIYNPNCVVYIVNIKPIPIM